jgi:hypothetical protein
MISASELVFINMCHANMWHGKWKRDQGWELSSEALVETWSSTKLWTVEINRKKQMQGTFLEKE